MIDVWEDSHKGAGAECRAQGGCGWFARQREDTCVIPYSQWPTDPWGSQRSHFHTGLRKPVCAHKRCPCAFLTSSPYFILMFINHPAKINIFFYGLFELKRLAAGSLCLLQRYALFSFFSGNKNPRNRFHSKLYQLTQKIINPVKTLTLVSVLYSSLSSSLPGCSLPSFSSSSFPAPCLHSASERGANTLLSTNKPMTTVHRGKWSITINSALGVHAALGVLLEERAPGRFSEISLVVTENKRQHCTSQKPMQIKLLLGGRSYSSLGLLTSCRTSHGAKNTWEHYYWAE